jgi:Ulp1 family protease
VTLENGKLPDCQIKHINHMIAKILHFKTIQIGEYISCRTTELTQLLKEKWIFDAVIDSYLHLLSRHPLNKYKILVSQTALASIENYPQRKEFLPDTSILMPICDNRHWILVVINSQDRTIQARCGSLHR